MTATRAVAFDLDGTLVWLDVDVDGVRARLAAMFAELGHHAVFRPILRRIDEAVAAVGDDAEHRRALRARALAEIDRAEVAAAATARPMLGAQAAVDHVNDLELPLGLVTDNGRACLRPALEAARLWYRGGRWGHRTNWAAIATRDDVPAKPAADGVILLARALLPRGAGTLTVIGDSPRDIDAARAADAALDRIDVRVIAVCGGRASRQVLEAAVPDDILDDLSQLARVPL